MAFRKYASAIIKEPSSNPTGWNRFRTRTAKAKNVDFRSILSDYHPDKYLLTHCTIISSVNTEEAIDAKKSAPYKDYYITPETSKYVNDNGDAWERELLLASYKSFIGAYNFLEHVQIAEDPYLKGRIIDAVARDLGDTVYVDILVATDRKHIDLIEKIESGEIDTLSMGSNVEFTICTKCGNVATDETELCTCVKYLKKTTFADPTGKHRIIAELCAHKTKPDANKFIEASYVAEPAFKGAVLRNIIIPDNVKESTTKAIKKAFDISVNLETDDLKKAASKNDLVSKLNQALSLLKNAKSVLGEDDKEDEEDQEQPEQLTHSLLPGGPMDDRLQRKQLEDQEDRKKDLENVDDQDQGQQLDQNQEQEVPQEEVPQEEAPQEDQEDADISTEQSVLRQILKDRERKHDIRPDYVDKNETLVRSFKSFLNRTSLKDTKETRRIYSGLQLLSDTEDWGDLYKAGFTQKDVLNINYFLDNLGVTKHPIDKKAYKVLEKLEPKHYTTVSAFISAFESHYGMTNAKIRKAAIVKGGILRIGYLLKKS
jgi:hypothetical protein